MGEKLAAGYSVFRIPRRDPEDHLHDQRRGIPSHHAAESDPKSRFISYPPEAAIKLLYLALQNVSKKWHAVQGWREALRQFPIRWPERIEQARGA